MLRISYELLWIFKVPADFKANRSKRHYSHESTVHRKAPHKSRIWRRSPWSRVENRGRLRSLISGRLKLVGGNWRGGRATGRRGELEDDRSSAGGGPWWPGHASPRLGGGAARRQGASTCPVDKTSNRLACEHHGTKVSAKQERDSSESSRNRPATAEASSTAMTDGREEEDGSLMTSMKLDGGSESKCCAWMWRSFQRAQIGQRMSSGGGVRRQEWTTATANRGNEKEENGDGTSYKRRPGSKRKPRRSLLRASTTPRAATAAPGSQKKLAVGEVSPAGTVHQNYRTATGFETQITPKFV